MKNDIIIDAIGLIDDKYIQEAKTTSDIRKKKSLKRTIILFAAVFLCISLSTAIIGTADIETFYNVLYPIAPEYAQSLKPINRSCIDNGIQVEVVSAKIVNNRAEIFIAMRDIEGNRIDETIDLYDSYEIRPAYDSIGTCNLESFDKKTGVATFLVYIEQMNNQKIENTHITFLLSQLLSQKKEVETTLSDIDLSQINKKPETLDNKTINLRGGEFADLPENIAFLKPEPSKYKSPVDGVEMSAIGYINNQLHIQVCYKNLGETDNHGWITLKAKDGTNKKKIIKPVINESFWDDKECDSYDENIFDIPYDELKNYEISAEFTTCDTFIEGDWEITFPLKKAQ